jgi:hypothetical protein
VEVSIDGAFFSGFDGCADFAGWLSIAAKRLAQWQGMVC